MKIMQLSEKSKDRILNLLLVCSVLLLINGFIPLSTNRKTNNPVLSERKVVLLQPLEVSSLPDYADAALVAVEVSAPKQLSSNTESAANISLAQATPPQKKKNYRLISNSFKQTQLKKQKTARLERN